MNAPVPPKRKMSTLTIVLLIVGGAIFLVSLVIGIGIWRVMASPTGRAIAGAVGETMRVITKAQKAPGTAEMRGVGCQTAMVLDLDDLQRIADHVDAGAPKKTDPPAFNEMATCGLAPRSTAAPSCEQVAKAYVGAVGPRSKPFLVNVSRPRDRHPICSAIFDGGGTKLRDADDNSTNHIPLPE